MNDINYLTTLQSKHEVALSEINFIVFYMNIISNFSAPKNAAANVLPHFTYYFVVI